VHHRVINRMNKIDGNESAHEKVVSKQFAALQTALDR